LIGALQGESIGSTEMVRRVKSAFVAGALVAGAIFAPATASAASFQSSSRITIPDGFTGSPYPSTITVSGLAGPVTQVIVQIKSYSTTDGDGVGMVLQGPQGQSLALLDGGPGFVGASSVTFADSAPSQIAQGTDLPLGSNPTFKPTDYYADDFFPSPGPNFNYNNPGPDLGGTATLASTFKGTDPNGTWKLFTANFGSGDTAVIANGWAIGFGGYDTVVIGTPKVTGRHVMLPVTFPGPGRALMDDASHPFYRASGKKRKNVNRDPSLIVPQANFFVQQAGTVDLPVLLTGRANTALKRKGKVTLPVRITFGVITLDGNHATYRTTNIPLRVKRRKR
jgi:hypothetical protein